jgi:hypothetical protein
MISTTALILVLDLMKLCLGAKFEQGQRASRCVLCYTVRCASWTLMMTGVRGRDSRFPLGGSSDIW